MAEFDKLWDYDHPGETEQRFLALLPEAEGEERAELLTQIARTHSLRGQFEEAHRTLDQAEALLTPAMQVAPIRLRLERGRTWNSSGQPATAVPIFASAWELALAAGEDDYAVDAAHMLGIAGATAEERAAWNNRALDLAQRSPKARRWLGSLYNNMGWELADSGRYAEALALFEQALAVREEQGKPVPIRIARWCVAKMLRLLGRTEEALAIQQSLLAMLENQADDRYIAEEIAACRLALNLQRVSLPDGEELRCYVRRPARPGPGVVLLHAWWGLHPDFMDVCDRLAAEGFLAVAPDLHGGKLAHTVPEAEKLVTAESGASGVAAVAEVVRWLRQQPDLAPGRVALLGFSMGGWVAIRAAAQGVPADAVVTFYGTANVEPGEALPMPLLGHFAESDEYEPPAEVAALFERLKGQAISYPGTGHWFFEPSRAAYDADAAGKAWQTTLQFLRRYLWERA